jgi:hypothetical protein
LRRLRSLPFSCVLGRFDPTDKSRNFSLGHPLNLALLALPNFNPDDPAAIREDKVPVQGALFTFLRHPPFCLAD